MFPSSSALVINTINSSWLKPDDFKTEAEFKTYFLGLTPETQKAMAESETPVAQRYMAELLEKKGETKKSSLMWIRAANNKDPIALLYEAKLHCKAKLLVEAEFYLEQVEALNIKDKEFEKTVRRKLGLRYCELGIEWMKVAKQIDPAKETIESDELALAKPYFIKSIEFCNSPEAAYNISVIEYSKKELEDAIHWLKLTLHFTQAEPAAHCNVLRATAHNSLAMITYQLMKDRSLKTEANWLLVVSHLSKAIAYDKTNTLAKNNLAVVWNAITDNELKTRLKTASSTEMFAGIVRTQKEIFAGTGDLGEGINELGVYPDPRKKTESPPVAAVNDALSLTLSSPRRNSEVMTDRLKDLSLEKENMEISSQPAVRARRFSSVC